MTNPGGPDTPALKCSWPWSHQFTVWEIAAHHARANEQGLKLVAEWDYQRRRCLRCGLTEQQGVGAHP